MRRTRDVSSSASSAAGGGGRRLADTRYSPDAPAAIMFRRRCRGACSGSRRRAHRMQQQPRRAIIRRTPPMPSTHRNMVDVVVVSEWTSATNAKQRARPLPSRGVPRRARTRRYSRFPSGSRCITRVIVVDREAPGTPSLTRRIDALYVAARPMRPTASSAAGTCRCQRPVRRGLITSPSRLPADDLRRDAATVVRGVQVRRVGLRAVREAWSATAPCRWCSWSTRRGRSFAFTLAAVVAGGEEALRGPWPGSSRLSGVADDLMVAVSLRALGQIRRETAIALGLAAVIR